MRGKALLNFAERAAFSFYAYHLNVAHFLAMVGLVHNFDHI